MSKYLKKEKEAGKCYGIQKRTKEKWSYNQLFSGFSTEQLFKIFKVFFHSALDA